MDFVITNIAIPWANTKFPAFSQLERLRNIFVGIKEAQKPGFAESIRPLIAFLKEHELRAWLYRALENEPIPEIGLEFSYNEVCSRSHLPPTSP